MANSTENSAKSDDASAKPATARRKGGDRVPESAENFEHTIRRVVIEKARLREQQQ